MAIGRVEMARIAVRLIRNDAASVRRMTGQAWTRIYWQILSTGALQPTRSHKHHEYASIVRERPESNERGSSRDIQSPDGRSFRNLTPNIYQVQTVRYNYAARYVHRLDANTVKVIATHHRYILHGVPISNTPPRWR